jgi:hypothetical protein
VARSRSNASRVLFKTDLQEAAQMRAFYDRLQDVSFKTDLQEVAQMQALMTASKK